MSEDQLVSAISSLGTEAMPILEEWMRLQWAEFYFNFGALSFFGLFLCALLFVLHKT